MGASAPAARRRRHRRGAAPPAVAVALDHARDALGGKQHEEDEDGAEEHHPVLRVRGEPVTQGDEDPRAEHRPKEGALATDDGHEHHVAGRGPVEHLGIDELDRESVQAARQAREEAGDGKSGEAVESRVVAQARRALVVLANSHQHPPEGRAHQPVEQVGADHDPDEDEEVERHRVEQVEAQQGRSPEPTQAVLAAGHVGPAEDDGVEHLREGEGKQREVHAARAHHQGAQNDAQQQRRQRADQDRQDDVVPQEVLLRQHGDVGAGAQVGHVAEGNHARVAEQQVEGKGEQRGGDDLGRQRRHDAERLQEKRQHGQHERHDGDGEHGGACCVAPLRHRDEISQSFVPACAMMLVWQMSKASRECLMRCTRC